MVVGFLSGVEDVGTDLCVECSSCVDDVGVVFTSKEV